MVDFILIKGIKIEYKIINVKKKNISFHFENNVLIIRSPLSISDRELLRVIKDNEEKVYKLFVKVNASKKTSLSFNIGDSIKVLEKDYLLIKSNKRDFDDCNFYVRENKVFEDVINLAANILYIYVNKRTKEYFESMYKHGDCPIIDLKLVKGYYGKYSKNDHKIIYNISLAFMDKEVIDYVIVHELSHIKYLNHQKEFYDYLRVFLPNYKYLEKRLKQEGRVI